MVLRVNVQLLGMLLASCAAVNLQTDGVASMSGIKEIVTDPGTKKAAAVLDKRTKVVDRMARNRDATYLAALDQNKEFTGDQELAKNTLDNKIREAARKEGVAWGELKSELQKEITNDLANASVARHRAQYRRELASTATVKLTKQVPRLTKQAVGQDKAAAKLEADAKEKRAELLKADLLRTEERIQRETSKRKLRSMLQRYEAELRGYKEAAGDQSNESPKPKSNDQVKADAAKKREAAADRLAAAALKAMTKDRLAAVEREKKKAGKEAAEHKAVQGFRAVKEDTESESTAECACSGKQDVQKQGGHCATWGWRSPWCYVSDKCNDRGVLRAKTAPHLNWIQGCVHSDVAHNHPPGFERKVNRESYND